MGTRLEDSVLLVEEGGLALVRRPGRLPEEAEGFAAEIVEGLVEAIRAPRALHDLQRRRQHPPTAGPQRPVAEPVVPIDPKLFFSPDNVRGNNFTPHEAIYYLE